MKYIWKKFPEEIIKGDNITESGFNYEEEYEKRVHEQQRLVDEMNLPIKVIDAGYAPQTFFDITSSPVNSSIWGAAMGGLLLSSFMPEHKKIKKEE